MRRRVYRGSGSALGLLQCRIGSASTRRCPLLSLSYSSPLVSSPLLSSLWGYDEGRENLKRLILCCRASDQAM